MDISSLISLASGAVDLDKIAKATGVSKDQIEKVVSNILPKLAKGASKSGDLSKLISSNDIEKIVKSLLGTDTKTVVKETSKETGVSETNVNKVFSEAVPMVASLLGKQSDGKTDAGDILSSVASRAKKSGIDASDVAGLLGKLGKK